MMNAACENAPRHAYLIVAHGQFRLLRCLLSLLDDPRNDIYIHLDAKVKEPPCAELKEAVTHSRLIFSPRRYDVGWGAPSQSLAEMALYELAGHAPQHYAYYHLLSGACLPIKSQDEIHRFFSAPGNEGKNFLTALPHCRKEDYERFSLYHFSCLRRGILPKLFGAWRLFRHYSQWQKKFGIDRIKGRFPLFCRGQNWCSLTAEAVDHLLLHADDIRTLIRHTAHPDEGYKQLFIYNDARLAPSIAREDGSNRPLSLVRTDWPPGALHPRTFTLADYEALTSTPHLFARKFSEQHWDLVEKIAAHVKG